MESQTSASKQTGESGFGRVGGRAKQTKRQRSKEDGGAEYVDTGIIDLDAAPTDAAPKDFVISNSK